MNREMQIVQVQALVQYLQREMQHPLEQIHNKSIPIILGGDFNAVPHRQPEEMPRAPDQDEDSSNSGSNSSVDYKKEMSALYRLMTLGSLSLPDPSLRLSSAVSYPAEFMDPQGEQLVMPLLFKSAYREALGQEPVYTNKKPDFEGCLDYIWYAEADSYAGSGLQLEGVLDLPAKEFVEAESGGIPNSLFPSDHLPIMATFSFPTL
jgi:hypothetical protein